MEAQRQTSELMKQTIQAEEANRLKRLEMAKVSPRHADIIFQNHPDEYNTFIKKRR